MAKPTEYTYTFVRHPTGSQFSGLWDLRELAADHKTVRVVVQADSLTSCIAHISKEFEIKGY